MSPVPTLMGQLLPPSHVHLPLCHASGLLACGRNWSSPLGPSGWGQGRPVGPARELLLRPLESPLPAACQAEAGSGAESFMWIGCRRSCFIHNYFYLIQLFLEAIQHADSVRTRFSVKKKSHHDSATETSSQCFRALHSFASKTKP